jgi:tripartite-type tricarboxylate transporter receptor subunit TctC
VDHLAAPFLAKAAPDGYTIAVGVSGMTINVSFQPNLPFNPVRDFAPVTMLVNNPLVLFANPSFPAKDVRALLALAKAQPGKIAYGSAGNGSAMHLAGALFTQLADVDLLHVPYKGNGPAVTDVLGGQIPLAFADVASTLSFIKAGRLHPIGVTGAKRTATAPHIPTIAETGLPAYAVPSWTGIIAPARTPPEIVARLNSHIRAVLETREVREYLLGAGLEPAPTTPEEFSETIKTDIARWAKVIKDAGIKPE